MLLTYTVILYHNQGLIDPKGEEGMYNWDRDTVLYCIPSKIQTRIMITELHCANDCVDS